MKAEKELYDPFIKSFQSQKKKTSGNEIPSCAVGAEKQMEEDEVDQIKEDADSDAHRNGGDGSDSDGGVCGDSTDKADRKSIFRGNG